MKTRNIFIRSICTFNAFFHLFFSIVIVGSVFLIFRWLKIINDKMALEIVSFWGRWIATSACIKVNVIERSKLDPNKQYILMMNHQSMLDIPVTLGYLPIRFVMIAKKELFSIPIFGQILKAINYIPIDRENTKNALEALKQTAKIIKEKKFSVGIYPEGTRTKTGQLSRFKKGGFVIAKEENIPIVPITIKGNFEILPKGKLFPNMIGEVDLIIWEEVDVKDKEVEDLINIVYNRIEQGLKEGDKND